MMRTLVGAISLFSAVSVLSGCATASVGDAEKAAETCHWNLVNIDGATEQWALEKSKQPGDVPRLEELSPADGRGYLREYPVCPSGGEYVMEGYGISPRCSSGLPGHTIIQTKE